MFNIYIDKNSDSAFIIFAGQLFSAPISRRDGGEVIYQSEWNAAGDMQGGLSEAEKAIFETLAALEA